MHFGTDDFPDLGFYSAYASLNLVSVSLSKRQERSSAH
jgi:hypothetical protein